MRLPAQTHFIQPNNGNVLRPSLRWLISGLSFLIVLAVFWCLKLTGITLAGGAFCGLDEHIHGPDCPSEVLICQLEEEDAHTHSEACIPIHLICGQEEIPAHSHDQSCLDRELICQLPEQDGHTHSDSCRNAILTCLTEETEGHTHSEECHTLNLLCEQAEEAEHWHSESCYSPCPLPESEEHTHSEECTPLICSLPETAGHSHTDRCYESVLHCILEETPGHAHDESCFTPEETIVCGLEESLPHAHGEECYLLLEGCYICGLEETEGHVHTDTCRQPGIGFGCGLTEAEGHEHSSECLTGETELDCGLEATPGHTHEGACYDILDACPLTEHIHIESCYSDISADLETEDDWDAEMEALSPGLSTAEDLITAAQSQLGQEESVLNFQVDANGIRRGITRYGQWYGNPYGDWSAMFVSFCLHYAGVEDMPANAGAESMRLEWEQEGLYAPQYQHTPAAGDLIFLAPLPEIEPDLSAPLTATSVAIVTDITDGIITAIAGDVDNAVAYITLAADSPSILGYGLVPECSPYALVTLPPGEQTAIAQTVDYDTGLLEESSNFVIYSLCGEQYFALDGDGNNVEVTVDENGNIFTDLSDPDLLIWTFSGGDGSYTVENLSTGYSMPVYDNGGSGITTVSPAAPMEANSGIMLLSLDEPDPAAPDSESIVTYQLARASYCTIWLDGTNGNLMSLGGSVLRGNSVIVGNTFTLPTSWTSPAKYSYVLKGWYDVKNGRYYEPGDTITATGDMLFYADWIAATYDIGQLNRNTIDTVDTSDFITTHVFDYNSLFNVLSLNNNYSGGSSTRWTLVEDDTVNSTGKDSLNFIFVDYDDPGNPGAITYPVGRNQANGVDYTVVTPGLYDDTLTDLLFDTDLELAGKHYLGTGNYLFRYGADPSDEEHYGYYFYDARLNAASYHQGQERFYVYDYLERTVDSASNNSYSDFLPLNSPYANTNGKSVGTYTYNGDHGEYVGTTHFAYDTKYSDSSNSTNRVITNFGFGLATEMNFYLPAKPGTRDEDGTYANQSITGEDMVFEFSGDDDVWVLIDDQLVLDIGGIHGVESGSIDFSTGQVIVDGEHTGTVTHLPAGSHKLTMYYLERGSSMSNFKLRFNLSPRYFMTLRKEDTLTAKMLDGAQFTVYTDPECITGAQLWTDRASHERNDTATSTFTVADGEATMWGFAAGRTYYIVETLGPGGSESTVSNGIIRMRLNNRGQPDYKVLPNPNGDLTVGYTAYGFKVDEDTQAAYLTITNTDAVNSEPTEVYVEKKWGDKLDHSSDSVTVYLLANGKRIQSVALNKFNDWRHLWTNLPKTDANGNPVTYTVREATVPGYIASVGEAPPPGSGGDSGGGTAAGGFENGQTYLLETKYGYLGASNDKLLLLSSMDEAQNASSAQWVASVNDDGTVVLTNKEGQTLHWNNYSFGASSSPGTSKNLTYSDGVLSALITFNWGTERQYLIDNGQVPNNVMYSFVIYSSTDSSNPLKVTLHRLGGDEPEEPVTPSDGAPSYRITNTPAGDATISLSVHKRWDLGQLGKQSMYEGLTVQMRLLADGEDSGLVGSLNYQNGWNYTFTDLPLLDGNGDEIEYTVEEITLSHEWTSNYGPITPVNGSDTAFETTVTNVYHVTLQLPSTGSFGRYGYTMLGALIMIGGLSYYWGDRRRRERGQN